MEDVSDDDDEVEEEVVPPPPPPPPPAAPTKPTYFMEAACKKFEVPESAVLFSAYKPVSVKDGPMMGCITSSNSPSVWTNSGCSWKNLVRVGYEIEGILYEGLFVSFVSEADPESSDPRFLRRLTSAPTKHFVTELSGLGEKSSTKYANLCAFNMDSPRLDPVAARFRMLSKEEADRLAIAFRSKPKSSPAVAKKSVPAPAPAPEPSDEEVPIQNGAKRPLSGANISLNIDSHCMIPRDYFESLVKDSMALKRMKARE